MPCFSYLVLILLHKYNTNCSCYWESECPYSELSLLIVDLLEITFLKNMASSVQITSEREREREVTYRHGRNACSCSPAKILLIISGKFFKIDLLFQCFKNLWNVLMSKSNVYSEYWLYVVLCFAILFSFFSWVISCPFSVPTVDVFQVSTKDRFGLGHQLKK